METTAKPYCLLFSWIRKGRPHRGFALSPYLFLVFGFCCLISPPMAQAATYYISPNNPASDSNAGTTASAPLKTFAKASGQMTGGDELILLDGSYSEAAGTGYISDLGAGSGQPPSGVSISRPTVVRALNEGNVKVIGGLNLGFINEKRSFILIQGITFEGQSELYNTSSVTVKNCGFHDVSNNGGSVFGIGTNDHTMGNSYDLIEDVWIWGRDRIIAINYRSDHNVWRRVIIRGDGCNGAGCLGSGNPNYGMGVYDSSYISLQNVMVLDRILDGGSPYGDFITAQHTPGFPFGRNEWLGTLSLKAPDLGYFFELDEANLFPTHTLKDCIAWDPAQDGMSINQGTAQIENCTFKVNNSQVAGMSAVPGNPAIFAQGPGYVRDVVVMGVGASAIHSAYPLSYTDLSGTWPVLYGLQTCSIGCLTTDPVADGNPPSIKYIPRIEAASALKGTGFGGADYGANLVNRYGVDGSRWGDANFNALSSLPLWPYPNEARIKKEMCTDTGVTRGFCSAQTLTKYIWEAAGNPCPASICSGNPSPPTVTITAPTDNAAISGTISVTGTAAQGSVSLSSVAVSVDGGAFVGASGTTSWSLSINTFLLTNGAHVLIAMATDSGGLTATTSINVTVANGSVGPTLPTVKITFPLDGATISGTASIAGTAAAGAAGLAGVAISVDGGAFSAASGTTNWSFSPNTAPLSNGAHTLTAKATDTSGNAATASVTVKVSNGSTGAPPPDAAPKLNTVLAYPNPAVNRDPVIRALVGVVSSVEVTIFDISGRVVHSGSVSGAPTGIANGQYYYDYTWTGHKASGIYFAVIHGKSADGSVIRARTRFAVVN